MRNALIFIGLCSLPAFAQWVDHGTVMEATDKISVNAGSTVSAFSQMDIKGVSSLSLILEIAGSTWVIFIIQASSMTMVS